MQKDIKNLHNGMIELDLMDRSALNKKYTIFLNSQKLTM